MFLVNYNSQAGITFVDYIKVTEFQGGGGSTTISGDAISAGTITSNNIGSSTGTILSLDNGKAYFGGYDAYTGNNGVLLDGPNAQFAVGRASGNYMRFNHTAGKLEVKSDNFTIAANGDMYIGGTNASISSSNGEMEISASGLY